MALLKIIDLMEPRYLHRLIFVTTLTPTYNLLWDYEKSDFNSKNRFEFISWSSRDRSRRYFRLMLFIIIKRSF